MPKQVTLKSTQTAIREKKTPEKNEQLLPYPVQIAFLTPHKRTRPIQQKLLCVSPLINNSPSPAVSCLTSVKQWLFDGKIDKTQSPSSPAPSGNRTIVAHFPPENQVPPASTEKATKTTTTTATAIVATDGGQWRTMKYSSVVIVNCSPAACPSFRLLGGKFMNPSPFSRTRSRWKRNCFNGFQIGGGLLSFIASVHQNCVFGITVQDEPTGRTILIGYHCPNEHRMISTENENHHQHAMEWEASF